MIVTWNGPAFSFHFSARPYWCAYIGSWQPRSVVYA